MGNCLSCGLNMNLDYQDVQPCICPAPNSSILRLEMDALRAVMAEVERKIPLGDDDNMMRVREVVRTWIASVQSRDEEVSRILSSLGTNGCSYLPCSNYNLSVRINAELDAISRLRNQRKEWGDQIVETIQPQQNLSFRISLPRNMVTTEDTVSQVLDYLKDDGVGIVGIYGMGGVGKTTLVKQILHRIDSFQFDKIVSVVVSRSLDVSRIQSDIAAELGFPKDEMSKHGDQSGRAAFLHAQLSNKKFLLVLDDLWKRVDLQRIGIPSCGNNDNRCKVILTTRDERVCTDMGSEKMVKVPLMQKEQSWKLFQKTILWDDAQFEAIGVRKIAAEMVSKCGGLPLLVETVGRAMATKKTFRDWENAKEDLDRCPEQIRDMKDVYEVLKFSFDHLRDEEHRSCLRCTALFPEDYSIPIKEMVDYCVGGGYVSAGNNDYDLIELRRRGETIVSDLVDASLLERVTEKRHHSIYEPEEYCVKVHDAIRDMVIWLGDRQHNKILTNAGEGLENAVTIDLERWHDAQMVSFRDSYFKRFVIGNNQVSHSSCSRFTKHQQTRSHFCNNMHILLLNRNRSLEVLPKGFFKHFPSLRVLDLSWTSLQQIPTSLFSLKSLQYLNLSWTDIKALPKEMGNLTNLMHLDLHDMFSPPHISDGVFASLSKLQSLDLSRCDCLKASIMEELERLPLLKEVALYIGKVSHFQILTRSDKLSRANTRLVLHEKQLSLTEKIKGVSRFRNLQHLEIRNCLRNKSESEELVIDAKGFCPRLEFLDLGVIFSIQSINIVNGQLNELTILRLSQLAGLRDISRCLCQLPNLKYLAVTDCNEIVELLGNGHDEGGATDFTPSFPKLQLLELIATVNMESISGRRWISMPSLIKIVILSCPSLKKLWILTSDTQKVEIRCKEEWWEALQWEEATPPPNLIPVFDR